jgi:hypothetical protein
LLHARIVWASALRAITSLGDSCRESLASGFPSSYSDVTGAK